MIAANELRIGNWIFDPECDPNYFQVEQLRKYVGSEIWAYYRSGSIKAKEIEPILLTEEWLERFGLKANSNYYFQEIDEDYGEEKAICIDFEQNDESGINIGITSGRFDKDGPIDGSICYFPLSHIKYAHRLQNIFFSLTGKEL